MSFNGTTPVITRGLEFVNFILSNTDTTPTKISIGSAPIAKADQTKIKGLVIGSLVNSKAEPLTYKLPADVKAENIAGISLQAIDAATGYQVTQRDYSNDAAFIKPSAGSYTVTIKSSVIPHIVALATDKTLFDALAAATTQTAKTAAQKAIDDVQSAITDAIHALYTVVICGK